MKFFENLKAQWNAKTPAEKVKMVLEGVCNLGADLMMGYLNVKLIPADEKKWKKAVCIVTSGGLGMAVGKIASDSINEMIDAVMDAKNEEDDNA